MRAAEILRKLADVIDSQDSDGQAPTEITNRPDQISVEVDQPTNTQGTEQQNGINVKSMVAPLQQKLDLMKKLAGIPDEDAPPEDEMSIMKRNAGIKPVVIAMADEDEPFDG